MSGKEIVEMVTEDDFYDAFPDSKRGKLARTTYKPEGVYITVSRKDVRTMVPYAERGGTEVVKRYFVPKENVYVDLTYAKGIGISDKFDIYGLGFLLERNDGSGLVTCYWKELKMSNESDRELVERLLELYDDESRY